LPFSLNPVVVRHSRLTVHATASDSPLIATLFAESSRCCSYRIPRLSCTLGVTFHASWTNIAVLVVDPFPTTE
jgi:hypothetical protein